MSMADHVYSHSTWEIERGESRIRGFGYIISWRPDSATRNPVSKKPKLINIY